MRAARATTLRAVGWICLVTALVHTAAELLAVYMVREGNLGDFSPVKLLRFVPEHALIWRLTFLFTTLASSTLVIFLVALSQLIDRRFRVLTVSALALAILGAANDLNAQCSMLVFFADLAYSFRAHGSFLLHETMQLAWATMNHSLSQGVLIGNTLYSIAGTILAVCALRTRGFPRWVAWLALPIWFVSFNITLLVFFGILQWALVLRFAATIAFVCWVVILGLAVRSLAREPEEPERIAEPAA